MPNIIVIDWLSITSKVADVSDFLDLIGMKRCPWVTGRGAHGFKQAIFYEHIKIHFDRDDGYTWLEMSGKGCRAFESFGNGDFESLFDLVKTRPDEFKVTRLDIAYDDHDGIININELISDTRQENFVSRWQDWEIREGTKGSSVCHGSLSSEVYLRIYDKAKERNLTDGSHWIRIELQLRRDRAFGFISRCDPIGKLFKDVLLNYLRYVEKTDNDINKWRWSLKNYWSKLVEDAVKQSIYIKVGTDYNFSNLDNFVFNLSGNAIDTALIIYGEERFMERLKERTTRMNPKYERLIDISKRLYKKTESKNCSSTLGTEKKDFI